MLRFQVSGDGPTLPWVRFGILIDVRLGFRVSCKGGVGAWIRPQKPRSVRLGLGWWGGERGRGDAESWNEWWNLEALLSQGLCTWYLPQTEEFVMYGLLMVEVESVETRNGYCRRQLKITNTKVGRTPVTMAPRSVHVNDSTPTTRTRVKRSREPITSCSVEHVTTGNVLTHTIIRITKSNRRLTTAGEIRRKVGASIFSGAAPVFPGLYFTESVHIPPESQPVHLNIGWCSSYQKTPFVKQHHYCS